MHDDFNEIIGLSLTFSRKAKLVQRHKEIDSLDRLELFMHLTWVNKRK